MFFFTNQYLFNQSDRYITISESMERLLIERGVKKPITVVHNGISLPLAAPCSMRQEQPFVLGLLGRIEFNQKRQDFIRRHRGTGQANKTYSGNDRASLEISPGF